MGNFTRKLNNLYILEDKPTVFMSIREEMYEKSLNKKQVDRMFRVHELHKRCGYTSLDNLQTMLRHNSITGTFGEGEVNETDVSNYQRHMHSQYCNGCNFAKLDSAPASRIDHRVIANTPGTLHADVMHITHDYGQIHYLAGADEQTSMIFAVQLQNTDSSEISRAFNLIRAAYTKHGHQLTVIHLDNERGLNSAHTNREVHEGGTDTDFHTPGRHVRKAEVTIKAIKRAFKATIVNLDYACPISLYPYAIKWCIQCLNLVSKTGNNILAPWTMFTGKKLNFEEHFSAKFGDIVTVKANADESKRPRTNKPMVTFGIIVARDDNMRGTHVVIDLDTKRSIKRRQFKIFKGADNSTILNRIQALGRSSKNTNFGHIIEDEELRVRHNPDDEADDIVHTDTTLDAEENNNNTTLDELDCEEEENEALEGLGDITESDDDSDVNSISDDDTDKWEEQLDEELLDIINNNSNSEENSDNLRRSTRRWSPSEKYLERFMFKAVVAEDNMTVAQAIQRFGAEQTSIAIKAEIDNMIEKGVWRNLETNQDRGMNIVPSQMILRAKYDASGNFIKLKARLVACGNRERLPEHFRRADVESPTANYNNILLLLNIAVIRKMRMAILDVTAAYLHADIEGDIYMRINADVNQFVSNQSQPMVVKLNKCIYGLKQSGRKWYELLCSTFNSMGFRTSQFDACIFYKISNPAKNIPDCYIIIYVDDIKILAADDEIKLQVIQRLEAVFGKVTIQTGPEFNFLGLRIILSDGHAQINQFGYADKITAMIEDSTCPKTPHRNSFKPIRPASKLSERNDYKSNVMKLMYLSTRTRPDISYNTSILATRTDPQQIDVADVDRILRYVKHTKSDGLSFGGNEVKIRMYCDAAFNVHEDRKSQSGFVIFLNDESAPILFKSKKQSALAQSSTEAEIIALFEAVRHLMLIVNLLEELGITVNKPIPVWEDNMAVIELISSDKILKGNARFIDRKYLSTREYIQTGDIKLCFVDTFNQVADCLTKAISGQRFLWFKRILHGIQIYSAEQSAMEDE